MEDLPPPPDVAGLSLDGAGTYTIEPEENARLCRSTGAEPASDGTAHPIYYYIATQVGMGKTVAGLCAACDFDIDDGPMMVGSQAAFTHPLRIDTPYRVNGSIISLTRKRSRKLGVMDLLEYRLVLVDANGEEALACTNTWALPRKELA